MFSKSLTNQHKSTLHPLKYRKVDINGSNQEEKLMWSNPIHKNHKNCHFQQIIILPNNENKKN